jgi:hypothetical protein
MTVSSRHKRPMAKVRRVGLFSRQIIERLSLAGVEALLAGASRLSEGQCTGKHYYGSTMVTLDLRQLADRVRDPCDVATANRLAAQMADQPLVVERLGALARHEARRVAGTPLRGLETDVRIRAEGCWVFVDIDVEGEAEAEQAADGHP